MQQTIPLGRVLGIRVGLHYTWFVIFLLVSVTLAGQFESMHPQWAISAVWTLAVTTSLLFFASILLHEFGHSVMALFYGVPVRAITLFIFGGVAQTAQDSPTARAEFWIAIAGPLVSMALAGAFYVLGDLFAGNAFAATAFDWLAMINFLVAVFNLLPGFPLDGGRILRAIVWGWSGNATQGMRWAVNAGRLVAYLLIGTGAWLALGAGFPINGLWLALIGWFLLSAANASARQYTDQHASAGLRARDIMRRDIPLAPVDLNLRRWVDVYALQRGERATLVHDADGRVLGLLSLSDCRRIDQANWPETPVSQVMTRREQFHAVTPDRKSTRLNSSHTDISRMPSSA